MESREKHTPSALLVVYYGVLIVCLVASLLPQYRAWGVNWWAYYPLYVPLMLFAAGLLAPVITLYIVRRIRPSAKEDRCDVCPAWTFYATAACLIVVYGLLFYLLRARTHFLGDGYTVLSLLAEDNPLVKTRELGEAMVHIWVKSLIGTGESAAFLSFQTISISAGVLFLLAVAFAAQALYERTSERLLFFLGLATGGYMLLFFGYVENYSIFTLFVTAYCLIGLMAARGKAPRWLILPPLALAVFFHVLGIILIPSAIYLLLANTTVGDGLARRSLTLKLLATASVLIVVVGVFGYLYSTSYFFRFAFVPVITNKFTVEGYTLFSLEHIADFLNLVILLLPGIPVLLTAGFYSRRTRVFRQRDFRFLGIAALLSLICAFVMDPKLGMPRDWDLFACAGVPLALVGIGSVLSSGTGGRHAVALCIVLNLLLLGPRAVSQTMENVAMAHFSQYAKLDRIKNRNARLILIDLHRRMGREALAVEEGTSWLHDFPEDVLADSGLALLKRGKYAEAGSILHDVVRQNPLLSDAWLNLQKCYYRLHRYKEALRYARIANGLNPYNPNYMNDLGMVYAMLGDRRKAKRWLKGALSIDSSAYLPRVNLVHVYAEWDELESYDREFEKLKLSTTGSLTDITELTKVHVSRRDWSRAAACLRLALGWGLDSAYVRDQLEKHPELNTSFEPGSTQFH